MKLQSGAGMHTLATRLWPLHRSLTGAGLRDSLQIIGEHLPGFSTVEVPTGTRVFDWEVPLEWEIRGATIHDSNGNSILDYRDSNLHVMGYSEPVNMVISLEELQEHLHSIPEQPDAIPYVTSYYNRRWGFCLTHEQRLALQPGDYHVVIDSTLRPGSLTYGEVVLPGESADEIFISTYLCHPSMANNELSGPVVSAALAQYVAALPNRHYTYRFVYTPESIGAIAYASRNLEHLRSHVVAAINLSCIGDDRAFTYLGSRQGNLRMDRIGRRVVSKRDNARVYTYLERGSDERHYGAPGIDLPMISIMRSRYADYPEYHTSLDDLVSVVTPTGLQGGFDAVQEIIDYLEATPTLHATVLGEPQLGKRGLYHTVQKKTTPEEVMLRTNILAYADGSHDINDMAELFGVPAERITPLIEELQQHDLIVIHHQTRMPLS